MILPNNYKKKNREKKNFEIKRPAKKPNSN
jgi:hypothetical protein